jgi:hypothetical protein
LISVTANPQSTGLKSTLLLKICGSDPATSSLTVTSSPSLGLVIRGNN